MANLPCEACGSSDGVQAYEDGHTFCFVCQAYTGGSPNVAKPVNSSPFTAPKELIDVTVQAVPKRGLDLETCEKFAYGYGSYNGQKCQVATYRDARGRPLFQKLRFAGKKFMILGDSSNLMLYGAWLWKDGGRILVVTEGECDAMAMSQAQNNRWPVVSIPQGANGAKKAFEKNLEFLEKFEKVILMFDEDEAGKTAAEECVAVLSPGKAHIAHLPMKDANEMLQAGRSKELIEAMWGAKQWRPDSIITFDDAWKRVVSQPVAPGLPVPHRGLMEKLKGLRPGEITVLIAGTGAGKSTMAREWAADLARTGNRLGYIGLEEGTERTATGLVSVLVDRPLHLEDAPNFNAPEITAAADVLRKSVVLYDAFGSLESENLLSRMRYLSVGEKCPVIFLDHLSIITSGGELKDDERRTIDRMMTQLITLTRSTQVHVVTIAHLSRREGKPHEEGRHITLADIRGSHGISQLAHNIVAVERDQQAKGADADLSTIRVLKCRWTGRTGVAGYVRYNTATGRQLEVEAPAGDSPFDDTGADEVD